MLLGSPKILIHTLRSLVKKKYCDQPATFSLSMILPHYPGRVVHQTMPLMISPQTASIKRGRLLLRHLRSTCPGDGLRRPVDG